MSENNGSKGDISALDAITVAQQIAFAPMLFQAAVCLCDSGMLTFLDQQGKKGATSDDIVLAGSLDDYAVQLLLDVGVTGKILRFENGRYFIGKVGHFLLHDRMTRVNMNFTRDVCYSGLSHLHESFRNKTPAGLQVFGDWPTIYPALSSLPEPARSSWFEFDQYYSDAAFKEALPHVFSLRPATLYDVGGNTGKWALNCCRYDDSVSVTLLDLPQQIQLARRNVAENGLLDRVSFHTVDLLSDAQLPGEADVWWMSQFLDCFSPQQIIVILKRVAAVMKPGSRLCILELFWDVQRFDAAKFSVNASSLYFSCMANGNSRFYAASAFLDYVSQAGLLVEKRHDDIGLGHTLLICRKS